MSDILKLPIMDPNFVEKNGLMVPRHMAQEAGLYEQLKALDPTQQLSVAQNLLQYNQLLSDAERQQILGILNTKKSSPAIEIQPSASAKKAEISKIDILKSEKLGEIAINEISRLKKYHGFEGSITSFEDLFKSENTNGKAAFNILQISNSFEILIRDNIEGRYKIMEEFSALVEKILALWNNPKDFDRKIAINMLSPVGRIASMLDPELKHFFKPFLYKVLEKAREVFDQAAYSSATNGATYDPALMKQEGAVIIYDFEKFKIEKEKPEFDLVVEEYKRASGL